MVLRGPLRGRVGRRRTHCEMRAARLTGGPHLRLCVLQKNRASCHRLTAAAPEETPEAVAESRSRTPVEQGGRVATTMPRRPEQLITAIPAIGAQRVAVLPRGRAATRRARAGVADRAPRRAAGVPTPRPPAVGRATGIADTPAIALAGSRPAVATPPEQESGARPRPADPGALRRAVPLIRGRPAPRPVDHDKVTPSAAPSAAPRAAPWRIGGRSGRLRATRGATCARTPSLLHAPPHRNPPDRPFRRTWTRRSWTGGFVPNCAR